MFCSKCGKEIPRGSKFCPSCGAPVTSRAANPNLPSHPTKKKSKFKIGCLGIIGIFILLGIIGSCAGNSTTNNDSVSTPQKAEQKKAEAPTEEQKQEARENIQKILDSMPQREDNVEKTTWYQTWGTDNYGPKSAIYWYVGKKDNKVKLYAKIVHFSKNMDWVFWDNLKFSAGESTVAYKIKNVFAGQSGGGKSTQVVMGGKYETLSVPFEELRPGFELLTTKPNPILRLYGKEHYYDYELTSDDIESLKTAIYLDDQLKIVNYYL
jgi:hypothetical protein